MRSSWRTQSAFQRFAGSTAAHAAKPSSARASIGSVMRSISSQYATLEDESLDLATDALMKRPELAKNLLAGKLPGPKA